MTKKTKKPCLGFRIRPCDPRNPAGYLRADHLPSLPLSFFSLSHTIVSLSISNMWSIYVFPPIGNIDVASGTANTAPKQTALLLLTPNAHHHPADRPKKKHKNTQSSTRRLVLYITGKAYFLPQADMFVSPKKTPEKNDARCRLTTH